MKKYMLLGLSVIVVLALGACRSESNPIAVSPEPSTGLNRILSMSEYYLLPGSVTVLYPRKMDVRLVSESPSPKVSAADPAIAQAIQSILDTYRVEEATL